MTEPHVVKPPLPEADGGCRCVWLSWPDYLDGAPQLQAGSFVYCPVHFTPEGLEEFLGKSQEPPQPTDNWADLSTLACSTCRFFVVKEPLMRVGRCRRHSPSMEGYPVVYERDWCGDHKLGTNPSRRAP
jgi:hypothetical protein